MIKYDVEQFLVDLSTILATYLNAKLIEIDNDKNDGLSSKAIDSNAIFTLSLDQEVVNYDPFILIGLDIQSISMPSASADKLSIPIMLVIEDSGDSDIKKRILRYMRALKEVFEENFASLSIPSNLEIQSLIPVEFKKVNSSALCRVVGILLKATLP
ncbi:MAG TPA: hypothetical protein VM682_07995 [Bacillus sp. (in: firmicutes)]|nr:hypothetical protein [Bacillus sp. (in: firmicutes)]